MRSHDKGLGLTLSGEAKPRSTPVGLSTWLFALGFSLLTAYLLKSSSMLAFLPVLFAVVLIPLFRAPHYAPLVVLFLAPLLSGLPRGQIVPFFPVQLFDTAGQNPAYMLQLFGRLDGFGQRRQYCI